VLNVVLDTNVYISALTRGGLPLDIFLAAIRGGFKLFISSDILEEVEGVLGRKFGWAPDRVKDALRTVSGAAQLVSPKERLAVIKADDNDNRILECAMAAEAQIIVTGDGHLLGVGTFRRISILTPRVFWDTYLT
jgi:putative PIN family toxin of toxin-antitoxin system